MREFLLYSLRYAVFFLFEKPPSNQPTSRLANIEGDWHEFESKALRRENERKAKEARRAAAAAAATAAAQETKKRPFPATDSTGGGKGKDKAGDASPSGRDAKRLHVDVALSDGKQIEVVVAESEHATALPQKPTTKEAGTTAAPTTDDPAATQPSQKKEKQETE